MTNNTSFGDIKRQVLQDQRQALLEEYQAANAQLARTLSDVERVRLERQLRDLEQRIAKTEADLAALDQPIVADSSQDASTSAATPSLPPQTATTTTAPVPTTPAEDETTGGGGWFSRLPDAGKAAVITGIFAVIVAFISVLADRIPIEPTPTPQPPFAYQVRVRSASGGQAISDAEVTIEVPGRAPLDDFTDVNGLAAIQIPVAYVDQASKLIIEAVGFDLYVRNITLQQGQLPVEIRLSPANPSPTPAEPATVIPTSAPQAVVTSPTLDVRYGPYQPDPLQTPPPVVTVAAQSDTFEITGRDQPTPAWWQVSALGQSGWVSATLVTAQGAVEDVPVMTAVVALQTHDGKYVTAWNDEGDRDWKLWGGDAAQILGWEKFKLQCEPDGRAVLRTDHDRYVTAMDDSDNWDWVLRAETNRLGASERFTLLDALTKTPLPCLDVIRQAGQNDVAITVQTTHGRYVTAMNGETGGDWRIRAEEPGQTRDEQIFTLIKQN